jgi:hypothetical protein
MWCRLSTISVELVEQLQVQPTERLRRAAADTASLAVQQLRLADPRLDAALAALREGKFGDTGERSAVQQLTRELDLIAWEAQKTAEERNSSMQPYYAAFARARAAASVKWALDSNPLNAALEAVYEAQAAVGDLQAVKTVVETALTVETPP